MNSKINIKNLIFYCIAFIAIPATIAIGIFLLPSKNYALISVAVVVLCNAVFLFDFEKSKQTTREIVFIAVLVALTVISRLIFAPIPSFKPVTAMVIITGMACGARAGYITGAMSAIVSDIFFGIGAWTPFQMFAWGVIGFFAGVIFCNKRIHLLFVSIYSVICGVAFSVLMDIWTVIAIDNSFNFARYVEVLISSLPFMAIYAVSNLFFILLLTKPICKKIFRIKDKFGIFTKNY